MSAERDVLIHYRMARARETLAEVDLMAQSGHWHGCVNRLYYACFYAAPLCSSGTISQQPDTRVCVAC